MPSSDASEATIVPNLASLELDDSQPIIYDRPIALAALHLDPAGAGEHYLIHYPPGLRVQRHLHSAAHSLIVLEGRLRVNGQLLEPHGYAHLPGGRVHHHEPADEAGCTFVILFHGEFDVTAAD